MTTYFGPRTECAGLDGVICRTTQKSSLYLHVLAAIFLGGAIAVFPILLVFLRPGQAITRHVIAVAQMLASVLLIDLTGGRVETHFHIFGSLAFLAFYRDWRVLVTATIVVALDIFCAAPIGRKRFLAR